MSLILLIFGLTGLWFGTEITLRGATSIAERFGLSDFIVGVAILSIGSDIPELAIAIDGATRILHDEDLKNGTKVATFVLDLEFQLVCSGSCYKRRTKKTNWGNSKRERVYHQYR